MKKSVIISFFAMLLIIGGCITTSKVAKTSTPETDEVSVGILHSLSDTMAISNESVKDAELLAIDEINRAGGLLGKKIRPIIEDGASDWPTFAKKAEKLLAKDKVVSIFGCWTSASRKAVLPVVEHNNGLLWYPVQYEGMESSPNIFYLGATANQQIVPAVTWLLKNKGKKFFLLGSDYIFPKTANNIIKEQLKHEGGILVGEEYTPLGHHDYNQTIKKIKKERPEVLFNTLNGDSNLAFFKQLHNAGISKDLAIISVSLAEEEIRRIGAENLAGTYTAWNYYQTTDLPENKKFVEAYKKKYGQDRVTSDPIEAGYTAVHLWAEAVKKAGSFDVDKVRAAAKGLEFASPSGKILVDSDNQHVYKILRIGKIEEDGQIKEVFSSEKTIKPDPYLKNYSWGPNVKKP